MRLEANLNQKPVPVPLMKRLRKSILITVKMESRKSLINELDLIREKEQAVRNEKLKLIWEYVVPASQNYCQTTCFSLVNNISLLSLDVLEAKLLAEKCALCFRTQTKHLQDSQKNLSFVQRRSKIMADNLKRATSHIPD